MKITYRHYRFLKYPTLPLRPWDAEEFTGRHGVAYHYQRGVTKWEPLPRGGYTICTVYDDAEIKLLIGIAECSPLDSFCYRIGREIAKGRLIKNLFDRYTDGLLIFNIFRGLGWTTAESSSEFREMHKALFRRYVWGGHDYFLKGDASAVVMLRAD